MMPHSSASSCASRSASNPPPPSSNLWLGVTHRKRQAIHVVCVCLCRRRRRRSSSSSSAAAAVSLAALAAPLVRMKSSAVQVPAAVSCSSAVPTEHHRQHTRCAPPTHPQRDRPRGGVVDGSPSAQRTSSTVRRPPGGRGRRAWPRALSPQNVCVTLDPGLTSNRAGQKTRYN